MLVFCLFLNVSAQYKLEKINLREFQSLVHKKDDVLYVVNFWATWCKPCIEELPGFMDVNAYYRDHPKFKMILISFDNKRLLDTKVKRFVEKNNIEADVYLLDDDRNILELLPEIDENWNGAIPSTVFYKNEKKLKFHQLSMTPFELQDLIEAFLE